MRQLTSRQTWIIPFTLLTNDTQAEPLYNDILIYLVLTECIIKITVIQNTNYWKNFLQANIDHHFGSIWTRNNLCTRVDSQPLSCLHMY